MLCILTTRGDVLFVLPMKRTKTANDLGYCLNGVQFFGFGLDEYINFVAIAAKETDFSPVAIQISSMIRKQ